MHLPEDTPEHLQQKYPYLIHSRETYRKSLQTALHPIPMGGGELLEPERGWDEHPGFGKNGSWRFLLGAVLLRCNRTYSSSEKSTQMVLYALSRAHPLFQLARPRPAAPALQEGASIEAPLNGKSGHHGPIDGPGVPQLETDPARGSLPSTLEEFLSTVFSTSTPPQHAMQRPQFDSENRRMTLEGFDLALLLDALTDREDSPEFVQPAESEVVGGLNPPRISSSFRVCKRLTRLLDVHDPFLEDEPPRTDVVNPNARKTIKPEMQRLLAELRDHPPKQEGGSNGVQLLMQVFMPLVFFVYLTVQHKLKQHPDPANRWEDTTSECTQEWMELFERALSCEHRYQVKPHLDLTRQLVHGVNLDFQYFLNLSLLEPSNECNYAFVHSHTRVDFPDIQWVLDSPSLQSQLEQAVTLFHEQLTPRLTQVPSRSTKAPSYDKESHHGF